MRRFRLYREERLSVRRATADPREGAMRESAVYHPRKASGDPVKQRSQ